MSYIKFPGKLHSPQIPGIDSIQELWICDDNQKIMFKTGNDRFLIAANFVGNLLVGGATMTPVYNNINGYIYWTDSYRNAYLYYDGGRWIYKQGLPAVMKGEYTGYYSGALPNPFQVDEIQELSPEGAYKIENLKNIGAGKLPTYRPVKVKFQWDWWMRSNTSPYGVYLYHNDEKNKSKQYFGYPYWCDDKNTGSDKQPKRYIRESASKFGDIHFSKVRLEDGREADKWLIGTFGYAGGWWEGKEPDYETPIRYAFTLPPPKTDEEKKKRAQMNLKEKDLTITFSGYTLGDTIQAGWIFEAATWK